MQDRTIAGKYLLKREIGRGGMGVVWEALDLTLRRPVAIKLMTGERVTSEDARRRFEREAVTIAKLRNKHIVQVYDYGIDEESPYIVMELLEGETLESRLTREKKLGPSAVLSLLKEIASGLTAANAVGIIHRDLKPANILLARTETEESTKILDFGVVWMTGEDEQGTGQARVGTPPYMSPEQVRNVQPHHSNDLWALAVVAYRALTGKLPFAQAGLGDLFVSICMDPHPPPSSIDPKLPPGIDAFFERALAKEQSHRFQSAREFCAAFAQVTQGGREPIKILVVDDEQDVQFMMKLQFRQKIRDSIYKFYFANSGQAALDELRKVPNIDVVLSDINMPTMDGLTLLERIPEVSPMTRVVMVSAFGDMTNIRSAMNRGAFDFVTKPIEFTDLEATIAKTSKHVAELRRSAGTNEENDVLRKFTSAALIERVRALGPAVALAAEAIDATVVFVDLCGFTRVTKTKLPGEAARVLNANFEVIVPALAAQGGVVDKFVGDAVMAVFQGPSHLGRALEGCLAVRAQVASVARIAGEGSPYAHGVAIGVSTGRVLSAAVGSRGYGRFDLTILGEAVNLASHLTRAALPGEILVDEATWKAAEEAFLCDEAGAREVLPRAAPMEVHNVLRPRKADDPLADDADVDRNVTASQTVPTMAGTPSDREPLDTTGTMKPASG